MAENIEKIYGIDLGTTYSCIACVDDSGKPLVIPNFENELTTPSVVHFEKLKDGDGYNVVVGSTAKENAVIYPEVTVEMFKREMGEDSWSFAVGDTIYRPENLSAFVLRKVVQDAEKKVNHPIKNVVITCPAWFGVKQRKATADAGQIAGLNVMEIINEPTAAALNYGLHATTDEVVLVYDLGGGTFDITMIAISDKSIDVVCTGGNHRLGGRDWDNIIVEYLASQFCEQHGGGPDDLKNNPETRQELLSRAETLKRRLSAKENAEISIVHEGTKAKVELSRAKFDELTAGLLEETITLAKEMLKEAKERGYESFSKILLVGGSTKMPQVEKRLNQEFSKPCQMHEPDEAVAKGAAWYGWKIGIDREFKKLEETHKDPKRAKEELVKKMGLPPKTIDGALEKTATNVTSKSFGVVVLAIDDSKEVMSTLIKKNDKLPAKVSEVYGLAMDGQESIELRLVESTGTDKTIPLEETVLIKSKEMSLPPGLPKTTEVNVTFELNEQGLLVVSANAAGKSLTVDADVSGGLTAAEVQKAKTNCLAQIVTG